MARTRTQTATPDPPPAHEGPPAAAAATETRTLLAIDLIDPNTWNPRPFSKRPDPEDQSLTSSIAQHGVLQNLLVRPMPGGRHQLIFGERRLRCARAAGLIEVPVTAREMDDHEACVLTVTENLQRKQLHFLDEANGVSVLLDGEKLTVDRVAGKLDKPRSWVARRHRLLNLTPAWRELARAPEPWTAGWSDRHFEQIAVLEADAQEELLARERHQLERCETIQDLARLIGSRTRTLSTFPWSLDDADLDPRAGACSACPRRSSRHPGLFDDQQADADDLVAGKKAKSARGTRGGEAADRCLDPLCAARKGALLVARKKAELAARHADVVLLQDGYLPDQIPGALRFHQIEPAKKGAPGAVAAVVANGPNLGDVRWVKPRQDLAHRAPARVPGAPPSHKSLAERQEQKDRQRKVYAIGLLKTALLEQEPPTLFTSVRLAVVFGTAQRHASTTQSYDTALPRVAPDTDPAAERRRMLGPPDPGAATDSRSAGPPRDDAASDAAARNESREGAFWHTFDALQGQDAAASGYLWARTLAVMLDRMTPNGDWRHVAAAWHEAERVAALVGLQAQDFLDRATVALPDPKSWAKERPPATATLPSDPSAADPARQPGNGTGRASQGPTPRALRGVPRLRASRLPR
jgi:ParB/RepB/Spo0J family partition protein